MGLVVLAALCVAGFAILFRLFERFQVPLLPAITINYATAFVCGMFVAPPDWTATSGPVLLAAGGLGALFVVIFSVTGLSAQRAGAARTTIAGRMSLVLTIGGAVLLFDERLASLTVIGILIALIGLALTAIGPSEQRVGRTVWLLPLLLFVCSGAADISVTYVQRRLTTPLTADGFPTLCFTASALVSLLLLLARKGMGALGNGRTWIGGLALGTVNYASLLLLMRALGSGGLQASLVFPLMNILAILFATIAGLSLFRERLSVLQWCGIGCCIGAMLLFLSTAP